ncbi:MAG: phosphoribosyl-AMP cyclohydrolase [Pseudomonadota bacterium]
MADDAPKAFPPPLTPKAAQDETCELRPAFNADGLIAAIAQDSATGDVLMLAWMNADALAATLETGQATYWSRSRQSLWRKGETSGHIQTVESVRIDCDQDAVLLLVNQAGGACHTGRKSCFYRQVDPGNGTKDQPTLTHLAEQADLASPGSA